MLSEGLTYTSQLTVDICDTAERIGSGDLPILATPRLLALMENAAMLAVSPYLNEGDTTVGGHIHSSHLMPTPIGATVTANATLTKIEGRKLYFDIEARQNGAVIAEGNHLRFIVNRDRFLAKALAIQPGED